MGFSKLRLHIQSRRFFYSPLEEKEAVKIGPDVRFLLSELPISLQASERLADLRSLGAVRTWAGPLPTEKPSTKKMAIVVGKKLYGTPEHSQAAARPSDRSAC